MMKLNIILIILLCFGYSGFSNSVDHDKLQVYLRMDKQNFYSNENVILKICIRNTASINNYFGIFEKEENNISNYTTFQPVVYDMRGREAEIIVPYRLESKTIDDVLKNMRHRTVELAPDDIIIHSINLKNIYNLKKDKNYRVKSFFFPDFKKNIPISSDNELTFKIIKEQTQIKDKRLRDMTRKISPSEVVLLALSAEKDREWDNFIKYYNFDKYIYSYSNFIRKFNLANSTNKLKIQRNFINFLSRERHDYILDFSVKKEETETNGRISYVDVIIDRYGVKRTERYNYRYTLEKYKNLWLITNLEATVMKGIKR